MNGMMQALALGFTAVGGVGVYLLLPKGKSRGQTVGAGLCAAALALLWAIWWQCFAEVGLAQIIAFYAVATATLVGAVMTVTRQNPMASALWFASVVVGTAGLFLLQGAQFLAAANVIVYAGAIIVMFLFVIMLAQQHGAERHDRFSREPELAVTGSATLLAVILTTIIATYSGAGPLSQPSPEVMARMTAIEKWDTTPGAPHVSPLGRSLFGEHWFSIELAGTLLFVAMVGAIVIAARRTPRPEGGDGSAEPFDPSPGR